MDRRKKGRAGPTTGLTPLPAEAQVRLDDQVAGVVAALAAGGDLAALQEQVTSDPHDPQWDTHLMLALGALTHPAIPPLLAALFGEAGDKLRRKALKKTLHRLKTRGVSVPENLLPREAASVGAPRAAIVAVFVSPIFGTGDSYVILEGPPEILRGNLLVNLVNDREGFRECVLLNLKRQQQAEFWEHFREQGFADLFSPPSAYAVALLEAAYTIHPDAPGAARYGALREKIFQYWGRPETAPDLESELPAVLPADNARLLEDARHLALDPLFHAWLPGPEEVTPWLAKLQEVENSPLVLSDQQKQIRIDAVLEEATRALYPSEDLGAWGRRLLAMAYYLQLTGRVEEARAAQVAAIDLAKPERGPLSGENPFLKGLAQYALRLAWEVQQPRETTPGLVTPPGEGLLIRR
jgi:hypothetical protein